MRTGSHFEIIVQNTVLPFKRQFPYDCGMGGFVGIYEFVIAGKDVALGIFTGEIAPDRLCNIHMSIVKCFPKGRISVILMEEPGGL